MQLALKTKRVQNNTEENYFYVKLDTFLLDGLA